MKTYLFYFHPSFNQRFIGGLLDEAILLSKENNVVYFAYCGGVCEMCTFNIRGSVGVCKLCSLCTKMLLNKYGIKAINLSAYNKSKGDPIHFNYSNAEDLRKITYRDVNIGLGITSSFISLTRNMSPLMDCEGRKYFNAHLNQNVRIVDALYNLINKIHYNNMK